MEKCRCTWPTWWTARNNTGRLSTGRLRAISGRQGRTKYQPHAYRAQDRGLYPQDHRPGDVQYLSNDAWEYRYRCAAVDLYLNPGDTARYDGNAFTVGQIVNIVSAENGYVSQSMDVSEGEI